MPDVKRVMTNPWVLGAAAVALVIGIFVWRRTAGATTVSTQVPAVGLQPGSTAAGLSTDQLGLQTGGIQQELSNLIQQMSAGFASLQSPQQAVSPNDYTLPGGISYSGPANVLSVSGQYSPAEGTGIRAAPSFESNNPVLGRVGVGQDLFVNPNYVTSMTGGVAEQWAQVLKGPFAGDWVWVQSTQQVPGVTPAAA